VASATRSAAKSKATAKQWAQNADSNITPESIRSKGVLSPLVMRRIGHFEIVAAARRYRAARRVGRKEIPVRIGSFSDAEAVEIHIMELSVVGNTFLGC